MQLVRLVNRVAEKDVAEKEGRAGREKSSIQTRLNARGECCFRCDSRESI